MKRFLAIIIGTAFAMVNARAVLPVQTVFTGANAERVWPLKELNADLPADWTPYEFLVLEFKASSSQRFDLGLQTSSGVFAKRIGPRLAKTPLDVFNPTSNRCEDEALNSSTRNS